METVIEIKNLAKQYRLGQVSGATISDDIKRAFYRLVKGEDPFLKVGEENDRSKKGSSEYVWALKDVTFNVNKGEVLGIIGRNGAGKSTLLKILSRTTAPTVGEYKIKGRVASLLEVGTGFHPDLTGRENVFLNGAILGMTKKEIRKHFDEIVDFSGVERYIDTPVKRYSSGMYVRLAFAVAAHLEPEILIVDEVLSVGDAEFQKKCLGKLKDVGGTGRTVLFVSHDLGAVKNLCTRAILMNKGGIAIDSNVDEVINTYSTMGAGNFTERTWETGTAPGFPNREVIMKSIRVLGPTGESKAVYDVKDAIEIEAQYIVTEEKYAVNVHLYFRNSLGQTLFVSMDGLDSPWAKKKQPAGLYTAVCKIPGNFFNEGLVKVEYLICVNPHTGLHVTVEDAITFLIADDKTENGARGTWTGEWPQAMLRPRLHWTIRKDS